MDNLELDVGGTKIKGVWIAILLSFASTIGGGIWTASEFFNRLSAQEEAVQSALALGDSFNALESSIGTRLNDYNIRIETVRQQLSDNDVAGLQGKLAALGTNLESIMKRQQELLDMRDKISQIEKDGSELSLKTNVQLDKLKGYDEELDRINKEINDIWNGMDALSNPLN